MMLQVSNLSKAYGQQVIFDAVSFTVNPGERIGLVGRNGHGKTTLFRMVLGEEKPDDGTISVPDGYTKGHLSQHIHFTCPTVLEEGCLGLPFPEDGRDESYKVKSILTGLGFSPADFDRRPDELSGGYQIRLNLAKVLVHSPNLLLLDEPTNYLDIVSIRWLAQFLRAWKNELVLITHDREFMDSITTHTMGIHRCKIRKIAGPTQKLYDQLLQEEEVYEQTRVNEEKKRKEIEQFINRFRAQATRARAVQSKIKALQKNESLEKMASAKTLDFEFKAAPFTGHCLIEARDLSFSFDFSGTPLIGNFSIAVDKRDRIGVIGKNGKGKTTLLNLLAGELVPSQGTVVRHPQLKSAYFGQTNINRLDSGKTVEATLLDALPEYSRKAARTLAGVMMFEGDNALKKIAVLSGGEKSRVLLGTLLASPANLLLLDEPTNHLDMESIDSLVEALSAFDGAVIIVTHSEMILRALATRLIVFDGGRVSVFEGTYQDFLERVGWENERQASSVGSRAPKEKIKDSTDTESCTLNTERYNKDIRRLRAELITSRGKVLGTLKNRISEIEAAIIALERQVEEDTRALLDASVKGEGASIKNLSKSLHEARGRIDALFDELTAATDELNSRTKEFEEKLSALA